MTFESFEKSIISKSVYQACRNAGLTHEASKNYMKDTRKDVTFINKMLAGDATQALEKMINTTENLIRHYEDDLYANGKVASKAFKKMTNNVSSSWEKFTKNITEKNNKALENFLETVPSSITSDLHVGSNPKQQLYNFRHKLRKAVIMQYVGQMEDILHAIKKAFKRIRNRLEKIEQNVTDPKISQRFHKSIDDFFYLADEFASGFNRYLKSFEKNYQVFGQKISGIELDSWDDATIAEHLSWLQTLYIVPGFVESIGKTLNLRLS